MTHPSDERLHWHLGDGRRQDPAHLLGALHARYGRPMLIAETGHVGAGRVAWLNHIAGAVARARTRGVPIEGLCLYPVVDRPDWENPGHWHRCGLWDLPAAPGDARRVLHVPFAQALRRWQAVLPEAAAPATLPPPNSNSTEALPMTHLVVFSHLRWDFVYQRPQHLLSRLAGRFEVLFVEEPMPGARAPHLERLDVGEGVQVLRPHLVGPAHGFHDDHIPALGALVAAHLAAEHIDDYWVWFYTPMALPLAADLSPAGTIYDCMDELSAFRHAPRQLLQRETALLKSADLVFTGGASLYEAKRTRSERVHCFPSSVDAAHFSRTSRGASPVGDDAALHAGIGRPRLGFFGVIDERLDLALVAGIADARPDWQLVMVGPVVKIDAESLPRRDNIHWLGQQRYEDLPDLVAGWDVCLLPFALNESTRFISPTKTLEYLAADRPAVSTPIKDVVDSYAGVVAIASDVPGFIAACAAALDASPAERAAASAARAAVVASTSWDRTAAAMAELIEAVAARGALQDADLVADGEAEAERLKRVG